MRADARMKTWLAARFAVFQLDKRGFASAPANGGDCSRPSSKLAARTPLSRRKITLEYFNNYWNIGAMIDISAVACLAALAHEHRLRIFRILVKQGPSGMPAGEIAARVGISATNTSFHLKELERAGLLHATRQGRHIRYAVDVEGMRKLLTYLTEDCCQGRPELCGSAIAAASKVCRPAKGPVKGAAK